MVINKNSSNTIVITLTEKSTLSNPDYIIQFVNDMTGQGKTKFITDVSLYPERYNKFVLVEPTDVELEPSGQWKYTVYEVPHSSPVINDISQAVGVVETGICMVKESSVVTVFDEDDTKNNGVFNEE